MYLQNAGCYVLISSLNLIETLKMPLKDKKQEDISDNEGNPNPNSQGQWTWHTKPDHKGEQILNLQMTAYCRTHSKQNIIIIAIYFSWKSSRDIIQ